LRDPGRTARLTTEAQRHREAWDERQRQQPPRNTRYARKQLRSKAKTIHHRGTETQRGTTAKSKRGRTESTARTGVPFDSLRSLRAGSSTPAARTAACAQDDKSITRATADCAEHADRFQLPVVSSQRKAPSTTEAQRRPGRKAKATATTEYTERTETT